MREEPDAGWSKRLLSTAVCVLALGAGVTECPTKVSDDRYILEHRRAGCSTRSHILKLALRPWVGKGLKSSWLQWGWRGRWGRMEELCLENLVQQARRSI